MVPFNGKRAPCGLCVSTVAKVGWSVDQDAKAQVDLAIDTVHTESTNA
jgi:hypothetical protein